MVLGELVVELLTSIDTVATLDSLDCIEFEESPDTVPTLDGRDVKDPDIEL